MDLPETPYEALSLAAKAFSDRIVVLDRARKSAEDGESSKSLFHDILSFEFLT